MRGFKQCREYPGLCQPHNHWYGTWPVCVERCVCDVRGVCVVWYMYVCVCGVVGMCVCVVCVCGVCGVCGVVWYVCVVCVCVCVH